MMTQHLELGARAELFVAHDLEKKGYKILERNYKKTFGEIDLIAQRKDLILFVEVKMRSHSYFDLAQVITPSKQKKIINAAHIYLSQQTQEKECRFDVALVELHNEAMQITYIENAFSDEEL